MHKQDDQHDLPSTWGPTPTRSELPERRCRGATSEPTGELSSHEWAYERAVRATSEPPASRWASRRQAITRSIIHPNTCWGTSTPKFFGSILQCPSAMLGGSSYTSSGLSVSASSLNTYQHAYLARVQEHAYHVQICYCVPMYRKVFCTWINLDGVLPLRLQLAPVHQSQGHRSVLHSSTVVRRHMGLERACILGAQNKRLHIPPLASK